MEPHLGLAFLTARVDQRQRHDSPVEEFCHLIVCPRIAAKSSAGQNYLAGEKKVTFTLIHISGLLHHRPVTPAEPFEIRRRLFSPLAMPETGHEHLAVDDDRIVRGEHHIGQPWHRLDQLDTVVMCHEKVVQLFPLRLGSCRRGRPARIPSTD
ncbi:hypothetical protein ACFWF7_08615 [Nocardia sp. NPDC060256]|uniref:hypothetical protein n=1 Tax=unclassified Nocardia TaxID=2637762 RepID=UPI003657AC3F